MGPITHLSQFESDNAGLQMSCDDEGDPTVRYLASCAGSVALNTVNCVRFSPQGETSAVFFEWLPKSWNGMTMPIQMPHKRSLFLLWCRFRHLKKYWTSAELSIVACTGHAHPFITPCWPYFLENSSLYSLHHDYYAMWPVS
jgi:hypothetical protein